ncbi:hypothetical protein Tco_1145104 [Tanacetum coccineum]
MARSRSMLGLVMATTKMVQDQGQHETARECTYSEFFKCKPLDFKGTEGVVGLTQWFKKIESVFSISNCTTSCQAEDMQEAISCLQRSCMDEKTMPMLKRQEKEKKKYMEKGFPIFLAHVTTKEVEDKSEKKRLEEVSIVRNFLIVFLEDLRVFLLDSTCGNFKLIWYMVRHCSCGYYRRFIEVFSKIAKPMTKLTQKKVKFVWGDKQEAAFQLLKQKLCSAPILALLKEV